jgi:choline dehydrogenase-like flavoprotein
VHALLHANVTRLDLVPGTNRVAGVRARTLTGRSFSVRARATVLAAGGRENARLLLASSRDRPAGVGYEHGLLGRFFMEHLHVPVGYLLPASAVTDWGFYLRRNGPGPDVPGAIAPTAQAQRRHRLLGTSIVIEPARCRASSTPTAACIPATTSTSRAARSSRPAAMRTRPS